MATREEVLRRHVYCGYNNSPYERDNYRYYYCLHGTKQHLPCIRNAKRWIDGFGFCTQHAEMVRRDLEEATGD